MYTFAHIHTHCAASHSENNRTGSPIYHYCTLSFPGSDDEPAAKRKKTEAGEGEKIISDFLSQAEELFEKHKRGEVSKEEVEQQMEGMKKHVLSSENTYIQNILASATQND